MPEFEHQQTPTRSSEPVSAAKTSLTTSRTLHTDNPLLVQQQALGNQAVQRLLLTGALQAKLRVGRPNDSYEQEADRVADTVMRMSEPEVRRQRMEEDEEEGIRTEPLADGITPLVQRQTEAPPEEEEEEEPPQAASGEVQPLVQRQEAEPAREDEEEEEPQAMQRKAKGADITHVHDAALVQRLHSPEGGAPLPGGVRSFFERRFGYDFSEVRIHDAYQDRADASSLGARAFTYGKNIWLGDGESVSDTRLMGHELTHVVQQNAGVRRRPLAVSPVAPRIQRSWWDRVTEAVGGAISSIGELAGAAKNRVLGQLAQWAKRIPGFDLLTVILGKDPISDQPVERNATNLIRGVLGLLGQTGLTMFENLQKSGAIDRAFEWFDTEISKLNLTWEYIKGLFRTAWDALSISDIADPANALAKLAQIFGPTLARLVNFASAAGRKVLEFVFEGALSLAGGFGTRVLGIIRRAGAVFSTIINDPIKFIGNLVAAVRGGFERFSENILDHLRTALLQWLFGALSGAGLTLPDRFDLKGIISIVLQILGLTYDRLRAKLVGFIGEKNVARIEGAFDFLRTIVTGGLSAAWEQILGYVDNLQEMVIGGIRDWVATSVVGAAITKLISMFNPAGAIIQAIMAVYNTVVFFIERAQQIAALAEAVFDSISNIAAGNIGAAINYVERTMARALPVIISFLARLIGLGSISDKIKDIIKKIQAPIERASDKVASFIVQRAKSLLAVGTGDLTPQQRLERALSAAQSAVNRFAGRRVGAVVLRPLLGAIRLRYQLQSLDVLTRGENWAVRGIANPEGEVTTEAKTEAVPEGTDVAGTVPKEKKPEDVFPDVRYRFPYARARRERSGITVKDPNDVLRLVDGNWYIRYVVPAVGATMMTRAYAPAGKAYYRVGGREKTHIEHDTVSAAPRPTGYETFSYAVAKAKTVRAHPVQDELGSVPGTAKPVGWDRLNNSANWVRGHLLNHNLGGPGGAGNEWNLVPMPLRVNTPGMLVGHEEYLKTEAAEGAYFRYEARVTYHTDSAEIGTASDFASEVEVTYREIEKQGEAWVDSGPQIKPPPYSIRLPQPDELFKNRKQG